MMGGGCFADTAGVGVRTVIVWLQGWGGPGADVRCDLGADALSVAVQVCGQDTDCMCLSCCCRKL